MPEEQSRTSAEQDACSVIGAIFFFQAPLGAYSVATNANFPSAPSRRVKLVEETFVFAYFYEIFAAPEFRGILRFKFYVGPEVGQFWGTDSRDNVENRAKKIARMGEVGNGAQ